MEKKTNEQGYSIIEFEDSNYKKCSIQESSSIVPHIWLGLSNVKPRIMAKNLREDLTGWVDFPLPENVKISTRMHLDKEDCEILISRLQRFVEKGEL